MAGFRRGSGFCKIFYVSKFAYLEIEFSEVFEGGWFGFGYFFRILFPTAVFVFLILPNFRRTVRAAGSTISFLPSSLTCNMVPLPNGKFESVVSFVGR